MAKVQHLIALWGIHFFLCGQALAEVYDGMIPGKLLGTFVNSAGQEMNVTATAYSRAEDMKASFIF